MPLTLVFQQPNDGKIDCAGDNIIRCMACGGKPPYKWSSTAGTFDKTTGREVKLSAPVNVKPSVAGVAYKIGAKFCSFGGFNDCVCQAFDCAGVAVDACTGLGCADVVPDTCAGATNSFTLYSDQPNPDPPPGPCPGLLAFATGCIGLPSIHYTIDKRTQLMKDDGCGPCFATMLNAVVTVTDSQGNSVSRSIKT